MNTETRQRANGVWITCDLAGRGYGMSCAFTVGAGTIPANNTPQAYLAARCGDAQTGGLLLSGVVHAL